MASPIVPSPPHRHPTTPPTPPASPPFHHHTTTYNNSLQPFCLKQRRLAMPSATPKAPMSTDGSKTPSGVKRDAQAMVNRWAEDRAHKHRIWCQRQACASAAAMRAALAKEESEKATEKRASEDVLESDSSSEGAIGRDVSSPSAGNDEAFKNLVAPKETKEPNAPKKPSELLTSKFGAKPKAETRHVRQHGGKPTGAPPLVPMQPLHPPPQHLTPIIGYRRCRGAVHVGRATPIAPVPPPKHRRQT